MHVVGLLMASLAYINGCGPPMEDSMRGGDNDEDGFTVAEGDCDDDDPTVNPGAAEVGCDSVDNDCDGTIDQVGIGWLQIMYEADVDGDGVVDNTLTNQYRQDGQPLEEKQAFTSQDAADQAYVIRWSYQQDRVSEKVRTGNAPYDESYQTDERGRILRAEVDSESDNTIDQIVEYEYDAMDRTILRRADSDGTGTWSTIEAWLFDGPYSVGWRTDVDADGMWDRQLEETRDKDGTLLSSRLDNDADAEWDVLVAQILDDEGVLLTTETDLDGDGVVDDVVSYRNNLDGLPTRIVWDIGNDGVPDQINEYEYDYLLTTGWIEERIDANGDGYVEVRNERWDFTDEGDARRARTTLVGYRQMEWWFTWDRGVRTSMRRDSDGDGAEDDVTEWQYDDALNLVRFREDVDIDGAWDNQESYAWTCLL